jgi:acetoin utilization deacetylase AcuC-like enzyme
MKIIYDPKVIKHNPEDKTGEGSYRLEGIEKVASPLILDFDVKSDIKRVHTEGHLRKIIGHCKNKTPIAEVTPNEDTLNAIYASVRLAVYASENNDFAITRPPGHHASKDLANGFCFVNNIAIAAQKLVDKGKKVCIIDIDGHHGDGTERIFYSSNKVLFCSIYQEGSFPFIQLCSMRQNDDSSKKQSPMTRTGKGMGRNHNLSLPILGGSGDDILLESLNFFKKYIVKFNPDVIGISAGFDGYHKDRLLKLNYSVAGFNKFGMAVKEMNYPVFGVLEGGYHEDVVLCIKSLVDGVNGINYNSPLTSSSEGAWSRFRLNASRLEGKLKES